MLRFDPPENAIYAEKQPSDGHVSVGWQRLEAWKGARGYREIARDLGCSAALLTLWKQGKTPAKSYLDKLESLADVPPIAWKHWICVDPAKAAEFDENAPLTPEKVRAALDFALSERYTAGEIAMIRVYLVLLEQRPTIAQWCRTSLKNRDGSPYVGFTAVDAIDALTNEVYFAVRSAVGGLVGELEERAMAHMNERERTKNAA